MSSATTPIDITNGNSRQNSSSPRSQSNLTTALQQPRIDVREETVSAAASNRPEDLSLRNRQESVGMLSTTPYGARAIPTRDGFRRESNALSGSLMGGMSWGGISMGSFVRDDIMMAGTSPYTFQSPSYHSSSYLPKMEANYMRNYVCCDIPLDSMHELLQHYEEVHAQQPTQTMGRTPKDQQFPSSRAANATNTAQNVQQQSQLQQSVNMPLQAGPANQAFGIPGASPLFAGNSSDQIGTFDALDDMDMDDTTPASTSMLSGVNFQPQPQFGRQQPRGPNLNVNLANAFQGQGLQTPVTPRPGQPAMGLSNNPTVSSVNTPALGAQTMSQNTGTPDSSTPGTPAELADLDYSQMGNLSATDYNALLQSNFDFNNLTLNSANAATIDDPAKRLLSKQGNKGTPNPALANGSEIAKRIRESQLLNGLAGAGGFVGEEIKPFKCPVIGCEKAYKNQNGLKYHKQHGHQNQQLKENPDGTFSIVDPNTSIPYPGTLGMEKEKPYRCEVCGKRYKNLNGLKYHRQHSLPCNPELKALGVNGVGALPATTPGISVNVAGAGLMGMGDGMPSY